MGAQTVDKKAVKRVRRIARLVDPEAGNPSIDDETRRRVEQLARVVDPERRQGSTRGAA